MKSNKLLLGFLGLSVGINIITVIFDSEDQKKVVNSGYFDQGLSDEQSLLFTQDEPDTVLVTTSNNRDDAQFQVLRKKISILVKQNKIFQNQIDAANQKQVAILDALNTIVGKIDNQLLTPPAPASDVQSSNYKLDFNSISHEVVKKCMNLTSATSSNIRQQQRQSRNQLLQNEEVDVVWNNEMEGTIQSLLSDPQLQNSQLIALNCRTTICQITVTSNSPAAKQLFETSFFSRFQQSVSQYDESFNEATNESTGVFYLTRIKEN